MTKITVGIPTKNRYDILSHCLLGIAYQTMKPHEVIIVDDTPNPINLTTVEIYEYAFRLLDEKGIKWRVIFGKGKGQHYSHQTIQEIAEGDYIFRIDDDEMAEPDCLAKLSNLMTAGVGAVAPCVLLPDSRRVGINVPNHPDDRMDNKISDIGSPNIQWFKWTGTRLAEHLYSCFLYRRNIAKYELSLSNKAHREETLFSHSIHRAGYKLLVCGDAKVWHWRQKSGGIRSDNQEADYHHDEGIFQGYLNLWGVKREEKKLVVLDCGIGDHWAFKNILPEMKEKYGKLRIACCFPDVFWDEPDIELTSIADAKSMYGDLTPWQVYKLLWDTPEKIHLIEGFRRLYL